MTKRTTRVPILYVSEEYAQAKGHPVRDHRRRVFAPGPVGQGFPAPLTTPGMFERFDRVSASRLGGVINRSDPAPSQGCGDTLTLLIAGAMGRALVGLTVSGAGHTASRTSADHQRGRTSTQTSE